VYQPSGLGEDERRPAVLLIHGGPLPKEVSPKDWRLFQDYGRLLAASGFVGVTFNHRFHGVETLPHRRGRPGRAHRRRPRARAKVKNV
jgi:dipeptidyl aminopeptidase/acylaminoacyl peptidase